MANFFAELKRRQMFRVAAAYAVVAWLLLQIVNNVAPVLDLPVWVARAFLLALVIGFPIVLLFVWMRDLAPADGAQAQAKVNGLDWILAGGLAAVIALLLYQQLAPNGTTTVQEKTGTGSTAQVPVAAGISIAVLPFANLSGDATQEFFSDGMTEEITAALARVQSVRMVGRSSAFQFKGQNRDLRAIGQALGANYLIDGSVRKAGDQVRITAQLIQADNGVSVWTESYDREMRNIFATQSDIATAIAGALRVPLGLHQGEALVSNRTGDTESYENYLRAKALVRARGLKPLTDGTVLLAQVVARNPDYAPAWALLADAHSYLPNYSPVMLSGSIEEARRVVQAAQDKAEMAAREAIRLDRFYPGGYLALARVESRRGKWAAMEDLLKQALSLDPNEPDTLDFYASHVSNMGRLKEALSLREKLQTLEPFVPIYNIETARILLASGQNQASIAILEAIPADAAGGFFRNVLLARAYTAEGRYAEAADLLLAIKEQSQVTRRSVEDAARLLRSAPANVKTPEALPQLEGDLSFVYAYIGAPDRVFEYPERQVKAGFSVGATRNLWSPLHAPLRKTERFETLMRDAGLVDYWRERGWPEFCRPIGTDDFACE